MGEAQPTGITLEDLYKENLKFTETVRKVSVSLESKPCKPTKGGKEDPYSPL